jgi:hypothetical protein
MEDPVASPPIHYTPDRAPVQDGFYNAFLVSSAHSSI